MRAIICLAALSACRAEATKPAAPAPTNQQPTSSLDRELARWTELDYRSPMRQRWSSEERSERRLLLNSWCESGNPAACRRGARRNGAASSYLRRYCEQGDEMSCRWTRWWNAYDLTTQTIPEAPYILSTENLRRGCAEGVHDECDVLIGTGVIDNVRFGSDHNCRFDERDCVRAAEAYLGGESPSPERARSLAELACQREDLSACLWLTVAYRRRLFEEPATGRGESLHRYMCGQRYSPFCAESDTQCNEWRAELLAPDACPAERPPLGR